jgi:hypothetical protein
MPLRRPFALLPVLAVAGIVLGVRLPLAPASGFHVCTGMRAPWWTIWPEVRHLD